MTPTFNKLKHQKLSDKITKTEKKTSRAINLPFSPIFSRNNSHTKLYLSYYVISLPCKDYNEFSSKKNSKR